MGAKRARGSGTGATPGSGTLDESRTARRGVQVHQGARPGTDGYWSKMVEKYLGTSTDGANGRPGHEGQPNWSPSGRADASPRSCPSLPRRQGDITPRAGRCSSVRCPRRGTKPPGAVAYNWSRTHRYVMAKALRLSRWRPVTWITLPTATTGWLGTSRSLSRRFADARSPSRAGRRGRRGERVG